MHITPVVIEKLETKGVQFSTVTLHVGAGTFKPVKDEDATQHEMHSEHFSVSLAELKNLLANIGNITAVGTTTLRTLESLYWIGVKLHLSGQLTDNISQWEVYDLKNDVDTKTAITELCNYLEREGLNTLHAQTQIMIVPGYNFKMVNRLVTNFHQPQSTLLLLVAAFIGADWRKVYDYALNGDFRFLSYGDGSLLIR